MHRLALAAFALLLSLASVQAHAKPRSQDQLPVQPEAQSHCRVTDGDTIRCGDERIRMLGLDAPEMRGECPHESRAARAAKARLERLAEDGITLERHGRDRYRRTLAIVRDKRGRDLAQVLIREGHAKPYYGRGPRGGWCD